MNAPVTHLRTQPHRPHRPSAALARLLARIPEHLRNGFTGEQVAALDVALDYNNLTRHSIDLRMTLFGLAYVVVLAGPERRNPDRRLEDRERHPLSSPGNFAFLVGVAIVGLTLGNSLRALVAGG